MITDHRALSLGTTLRVAVKAALRQPRRTTESLMQLRDELSSLLQAEELGLADRTILKLCLMEVDEALASQVQPH